MNHPDINKIIADIGHLVDMGMQVCLNIETAEFVERFPESSANAEKNNYEVLSQRYAETTGDWQETIEFAPIDSSVSYEIMECFVSENVREGTRLYDRLTAALKTDKPCDAFEHEIELCNGHKQWTEYHETSLYSMIKDEIVEQIGTPFVKTYPYNDETIALMTEARRNGRYCYISGDQVVISQVVNQPDFEITDDGWEERDTHYTLREWAISTAEQNWHFEMGGGMVYEPIDPEDYDGDEEKMADTITNGVAWMEELDRDFEQFCIEQQMIEDLWDEVAAVPDDPEAPDAPHVEFVPPSKERKNYPDGKYPIPGKPDDCFSDDDPWRPVSDHDSDIYYDDPPF